MPRGGSRNAGKTWKWTPEAKARLAEARARANGGHSNVIQMPAPADNSNAQSTPATPKQAPMFSADSVERILHFFNERQSRANARSRSEDWNPYVIRPQLFGPVAEHIKKHNPQLAMDKVGRLAMDNGIVCQAWQAGGLLNNVVSEGLLFLGYPYLSELAQRPEFRLIAEIRAEEMVRKWTRLRGVQDESTKTEKDDDQPGNKDDEERQAQKKQAGEKPRSDQRNKEIEEKIKELRDFEEHLKVKGWFKDVASQNDFFGLSHLLIDRKGTNVGNAQDPELSVNIGNGRDKTTDAKFAGVKNWLRGLRTIEPIWVYPTTYNAMNPLIETWYDPQLWYVMGTQIHKSQLLQFIGHPVPDILKPAYAFGGLSMTQMAQPYVDIWLRTRTSVGDIIHAFSVMVLLTNLGTKTMPGGAGGGGGDVLARANIFNMFRDNMGLFVVDKATEDFKNVSAPLGGLDDLQAQSQEHMSSITRIPLVKLTGIQPKGLNATSEGELRAFEETVAGMQEHLFRTKLTSIYDFMQYSLWGKRDEDITFDFLPLREETPKEKAEIRKLEAETNQILIDSGQVSQEEARRKIATDPDSGFEGIDPDDVPELLQEEEAGLIPEGAGKGLEAELEQGGAPANQNRPKPKPKKAVGEDDSPTPAQARRHARITGGGQDHGPFGGLDEAGFEESKHPRDNDGKFAKSAGGGKHSKTGELSNTQFQSEYVKTMNAPAKGGSHYRTHVANLIKHAIKFGALPSAIEKLTQKAVESWGITYKSMVKAGKTAEAEAIAKKVQKLKGDLTEQFYEAAKANVEPSKPAAAPPPPPAPEKPKFPPPTQAEINKAKASTQPVSLQYLSVPGIPDIPKTPAIQAVVKEFNDKYANTVLTTNEQFIQKVNDFKAMQGKIAGMVAGEKAKLAQAQKEANEKAAAELKKQAAEAAEKNKQAMATLGISEAEATGFNALVQMMGGKHADVLENFKNYQAKAASYNYPISGFQASLIANYTDGGYTSINAALRKGSLSEAQHVYVKLMNKALQAMPTYKGVVQRGTSLPADEQALYKVGHVVEERAFTSTSITKPWSGNTRFTINAIGKRGAHVRKLSSHPGEDEVVFSARTFFKVTKVEQTGGGMHVHMDELEE